MRAECQRKTQTTENHESQDHCKTTDTEKYESKTSLSSHIQLTVMIRAKCNCKANDIWHVPQEVSFYN